MSQRTWALFASGVVLAVSFSARAQDPYQQPQQYYNDQQQPYAQPQYPQQQYPQQYAQPQYPQQYQQPQAQPYAQQPYAQEQYGFVGAHPVPYDQGGGYCYAQGAHYHAYPPFDQHLFRESGGWFYFVGDPTDFGYAQQTWVYSGNHPIPAAYGGGYCLIDWAHRHHYLPPSELRFNYSGGVYVYAGAWDPYYWQYRTRYSPYWGGYYRSNYIGGRYYVSRPPAVYRPSLTWGAPGVYRPGYGAPPRVYTTPPRTYVAPSVGVGVRGGVYVAPSRPSVGVSVGGGVRVAPAPGFRHR